MTVGARIWLIGYMSEPSFQSIADAVLALGQRYGNSELQVFDLDTLSDDTVARLSDDLDSLTVDIPNTSEFRIASNDVVYHRATVRSFDDPRVSAAHVAVLPMLLDFLNNNCAFVVNRPCAAAQNGLKLYHLASLAQVGFQIPQTVAGTDVSALEQAVQPDGNWISKGCSGVRTRVSVVQRHDLLHFGSVARCPVQFQRRAGGADVRVHATPWGCVALRIVTEDADYRYASRRGFSVEFTVMDVPLDIEIRCREFLRASGMVLGGFDFRVDGSAWVALECNPMPGFNYYDDRCDGAVSELLHDALRRLHDRASTVPLVDAESERILFIDQDRRPSLRT